jgi:outer membrane immunogenic protein
MYRLGLLAFTLTSVVALGAANAADMYRAPEPVAGGYKDAPVYFSWSGFYVGANGGGIWSADRGKLGVVGSDEGVLGSGSSSADQSGGFGGGQIGYNVQGSVFGPRTVIGIEADVQGAGLSGRTSAAAHSAAFDSDVTYTGTARSELDWFGTVRARLGYAFDNTLIYGTAGFAFGGVKDRVTAFSADSTTSGTAAGTKDRTATGFVVGGGLEYALNPKWSVKGEYQYLDLGREKGSVTASADGGGDLSTATGDINHTYHTARIGLNYHVGPGYEPLK